MREMVKINCLVPSARLSRSKKKINLFVTMAKVDSKLNQLYLVPNFLLTRLCLENSLHKQTHTLSRCKIIEIAQLSFVMFTYSRGIRIHQQNWNRILWRHATRQFLATSVLFQQPAVTARYTTIYNKIRKHFLGWHRNAARITLTEHSKWCIIGHENLKTNDSARVTKYKKTKLHLKGKVAKDVRKFSPRRVLLPWGLNLTNHAGMSRTVHFAWRPRKRTKYFQWKSPTETHLIYRITASINKRYFVTFRIRK